uniref:p-glycoprotein 11 n=1 Tax=Dirofilaria immitis TaxID=6287 RepID=A0A2Z0UTP9_DIRIM|nr:P-glycoprotein 11 [Dirofilaria immitis]
MAVLKTGKEFSDTFNEQYEQNAIDKFISTILCRGDFARQKLDAKPVSFFQLFRFATKYDRFMAAVSAFLAILTGIGQPTVCLIAGELTNILLLTKIFEKNDTFWYKAYIYVYLYASIGITMVILTTAQYICSKNASLNITCAMRREYMKSLLRQDAAWYDQQKTGTLTALLNTNIEKIKDGIGDKVGMIIRGVTMFLTCLVIGFIYDWRITLVMFGMGPISAALLSIMARQMERLSVMQINVDGRAAAALEESIINVKTVAACNAQEAMIGRYAVALQACRKFALHAYAFAGFFDGLFFLVLYIFFAAGFYYGAYLYQIHVIMNPGFIFAIANVIMFGSYNLGVLSPHLMAVLDARVAAAVIYKIIDRKPSIDSSSINGIKLNEVKGRIEFRKVKFSYPTSKEHLILNELSWIAKPGDTVALVGHSGCGKSTSISLLTRLYSCNSGAVLIDEINVRDINVHTLRNIIGVVEQEPLLFNGTIKENIRLGNPDLTDEEIIDACKTANAHDFINKLSEGYDTMIGAGSIQLSGGQKQRIAIARTIVRNPKILLLDEATSALDAESEVIVQNALKKASIGRTTIIIAHRLSTLRDSNQIIVLDKGQVAEIGTHKELSSKKNGIYASLVKSQQFEEQQKPTQDVLSIPSVEELPLETFHRSFARNSRNSSSGYGIISSLTRGSIISGDMSRASITKKPSDKTVKPNGKKKNESKGLWQLYTNCHGNYGKVVIAILASLLRGMELPAFVLIFDLTFGAFAQAELESTIQRVLPVVIIYIALGIACLIVIFIATFTFGWTAECVVDSLRLRALRNVLYQDMEYFDTPSTSNAVTVTRISVDAPNIKAALDPRMMQIVNNVLAVFVLVIVAVIFNWPVGLLGCGNLVTLILLLTLVARKMQKLNKCALKEDLTGQLTIEIVEQIRTIQLITREEHFHRLYVQKIEELLHLQKKSGPYEAVLFAVTSSFMFFSDMLSYAAGIALIYYGYSSPKEIFTASISIATGGWALIMVSGCLNTFVMASPASDSLFRIINTRSNINSVDEGSNPTITGDVKFDKINFSYPTRPQRNILNGFNLTAYAGQIIAVTGPSGSGKSTVIALLERFYQFNSGQLKLDDNLITKISLRYLRNQMALVSQEPILFSGTIAENVLLGTTDKTMDDVREACRIANATAFIEASPQGYDTEVGEHGGQLSGGQKQRIAIARALVRNPKILLLDEATSALDAESERTVQQALDVASSGRTCITVAHRLSSIQFADQIFFVENGKVVEQGTHQELIELDGKYADLTRKQDLRS